MKNNMKVFHLEKDLPLFLNQSNRLITPETFFHKVYGVGCNSYQMEDEYSLKVLDFLNKEAELVRFSENVQRVPKHKNNKRESMCENRGFLRILGETEEGDYRAVYFYKDNLIFIKKDESGFYKLNFEFPNGKECICEYFDKFIVKSEPKYEISVLLKEYGDVVVQTIPISFPNQFDIKLNYGEKFVDVSSTIINKLNNKGGGLYILGGEIGSGKTSFLKYITKYVDREFIFIPNNLIDSLNSPDFLSLLIKHKNSVLVLEDAEAALKDRKDNINPSVVSTILNLSDGWLTAALNISIIITHNMIDDVYMDKALLRKGRLQFSHEFTKLNVEEAQKLVDYLKIKYIVTVPMSLAEIYYLSDDIGIEKKESKKIGFGGNY